MLFIFKLIIIILVMITLTIKRKRRPLPYLSLAFHSHNALTEKSTLMRTLHQCIDFLRSFFFACGSSTEE